MGTFKTGALVFSAAVAGLVVGYSIRGETTQVRPGGFYTFVDKLSDPQSGILTATGTWYGRDLANAINRAIVSCDRANRTCELLQANILSFGGSSSLDIHWQTFAVSQLDAGMLTAIDESAVCVRQTLVIDRQSKAVAFVRSKKDRSEICKGIQDEPMALSLGDPVNTR